MLLLVKLYLDVYLPEEIISLLENKRIMLYSLVYSVGKQMGKQWKQWQTIFLGSKITTDGNCSHEIKRHLLLGRKAMTNLDSMLKSRDISFANKGPSSQSYGFSSSHVWIWELDWHSSWKAEHQRIDAFELWHWRRLLKDPLTVRRSNQSILKEISPEYSLQGLMLKLKLQYFGHLCEELTLWKRPWYWERLKTGGKGDDRGWDGWIASLT